MGLWAGIESDQQETRGWSNYTFELSTGQPQGVRIVHVPTMRSLAWALFLCLAGIGLWRTRQRPREAIVAISLGVFWALVVPASYLPLASALFLAGLLSLVVALTRFARPVPSPADRSHGSARHRSSVARAVTVGLLLVVVAYPVSGVIGSEGDVEGLAPPATKPQREVASPSTAAAIGQPATANGNPLQPAAPSPRAIQRVIVPIDANRQPIGDKLYIPADLFRELYRLSAEAAGRPKGWLITRGVYEGTLAPIR